MAPKKKPLKRNPPPVKTCEVGEGLTLKQGKYVAGVLEGKTKQQAALDAGYSERCAATPASAIESENVKLAFRRLVQKAIPITKIVERLGEGLEAYREYTDSEGETHYGTDFRERREYLKLAATYGGYHVDKQEIDVNDTTPGSARLTELLARAAARLGESSKPE